MGEVAATMPPNMHPQAYLTAIAQKYDLKGIFYIDLWPIADSQVVLTDPELMNQVTLTKPLRVHPLADDFLGPIVGRNSIATSNGLVWKKTHNAMAPAFSWSNIRNLSGLMTDETMHFRESLDCLAESGEVFSMEDTTARLVFDIIARIVFNFSLQAQTKGSAYLNDLREMIELSEAQLSWSPLVKLKSLLRRQFVLRRLHSSITCQIKDRLGLLKREGIVPSRKDPYSILDLMLREQLQEDGRERKGKRAEDLAPENLSLLLSKYASQATVATLADLFLNSIKGLLVGGHGTTTDTLCVLAFYSRP
jgi:cytochrome P450